MDIDIKLNGREVSGYGTLCNLGRHLSYLGLKFMLAKPGDQNRLGNPMDEKEIRQHLLDALIAHQLQMAVVISEFERVNETIG